MADDVGSSNLAGFDFDQDVFGYSIRKPYESEKEYFKKNPKVAGMAAEDGKIVLNPYSKLKMSEKMAVAKNEAARLFMRDNDIRPEFEVTESQRKAFEGSDYAKPENAMQLRQTIVARILSGDPSIKEITPDQKLWAELLKKRLETRTSQ